MIKQQQQPVPDWLKSYSYLTTLTLTTQTTMREEMKERDYMCCIYVGSSGKCETGFREDNPPKKFWQYSDKGEVGSFNSRHILGAARAEGETGASLSSKLLHITGNNQGTYVKNSHQKQQSCQAPTSVLAPAPGHLSVPTARASTQSGTSQFSTAAPSIWIEPKAFPIPPSIPECIRLYTREPLYRT